MKKEMWFPFIPKGSIIQDPLVFRIPEHFPRLVHIPFDICRKIDPDPLCPTYWAKNIELPPIPLALIWALCNQDDLPFPGHSRAFKKAILDSNHGIVVLKKPPFHAPGYFEVHPWFGTAEQAQAILED
jgi:hypothetical protein